MCCGNEVNYGYSQMLWLLLYIKKNIDYEHPSKIHAIETEVLILEGNSEYVSHVRSNFCNVIFLRHLIYLRSVTNRMIFSANTYSPSCVRDLVWVTIWYKYPGWNSWFGSSMLYNGFFEGRCTNTHSLIMFNHSLVFIN